MCKQSNCGVCPGEPPEHTPCVDAGLDFVNELMVSEPVRQRLRQVVRKLLDQAEILFRLPVGGGGTDRQALAK